MFPCDWFLLTLTDTLLVEIYTIQWADTWLDHVIVM